MYISKQYFGTLRDGRSADLYTLSNNHGVSVQVTDYGGTIVRILVPDRKGYASSVVLGYDSLQEYADADGCLGASVGRFANRIAKGHFDLNGHGYDLACNNGPNHLHGGIVGFSSRMFTVEEAAADEDSSRLVLSLFSPDGEEGYPGNFRLRITFSLNQENELSLHYEAVTDRPTPVNLTNHSYFNLAGEASGTITAQTLWLDAESYLPTDKTLIPTGEVRPVDGTPFDFRKVKPIGKDLFSRNADVLTAGGYDHCFNFTGYRNAVSGGDIKLRAIAYDPVFSGRKMELLTNQPCVQLYTSNALTGSLYPLRGGLPRRPHRAFCLETQKMPDSIHHVGDPAFTDVILKPGERYDYTTVFRFSAE